MSTKQSLPEKSERLKIVVLDDDRLSSHNLSIQLKFVGENPMVATSDNWQQMFSMLAQRNELGNLLGIAIGVIKGDLADLLMQLHLNHPHLPILLLTNSEDTQLSQLPDSLRAVLLPLGDKGLNYQVLTVALNSARQITGHDHPKTQSRLLSPTGSPLFRSLSGDSIVIQQVKRLMMQVAQRQVTVLITGESGTGKEVVARNLHYHAGRQQKPLIVVNCTSVAAERFNIELFGQEQGFNGNKEAFIGLLERADGGTLFLDEVSELPLHVQGLLLRFLEDKCFQRIGSHEQIAVDVRVVAGTRHPLLELTRQGKFREDLYYRLSVVPIELPPLRERVEDLPVLIKELISSLENKGYESIRFNSSAIEALQLHNWPGNVRELANLVERLGIMYSNEVIGINDLPPMYRHKGGKAAVVQTNNAAAPVSVDNSASAPVDTTTRVAVTPLANMLPLDEPRLQQYLENFERQLFEVALDDAAGFIDYAAERVQLDTDSFKMRMMALGLNAPQPVLA